MHDIIDARSLPRRLGAIASDPIELAWRVLRQLERLRAAIVVYIDENRLILFQDAAYAVHVESEAIVGIYRPGIAADDIADDIRASVAARLKAIGILV